MADEAKPKPPQLPAGMQPPAGLQRPGIPGAGNLLDPAVRADIREQLQPALHDAAQRARGQEPPATDNPAAEPETPATIEKEPVAQAPAAGYRSGPYPHGDVDLRGFVPNVPPGPIRAQRGRAARRFYFLSDAAAPSAATSVPAVPPAAGPKPG